MRPFPPLVLSAMLSAIVGCGIDDTLTNVAESQEVAKILPKPPPTESIEPESAGDPTPATESKPDESSGNTIKDNIAGAKMRSGL